MIIELPQGWIFENSYIQVLKGMDINAGRNIMNVPSRITIMAIMQLMRVGDKRSDFKERNFVFTIGEVL